MSSCGATNANPFDRHRLAAEPRRRHPISPEDAAKIWAICEDALEHGTGPCAPVIPSAATSQAASDKVSAAILGAATRKAVVS